MSTAVDNGSESTGILGLTHREALIWEALEPFLETTIDLDLNRLKDNRSFAEMVRKVADALEGSESDAAPTESAVEDDEVDWQYADATKDGHILSVMEAASMISAPVRMRRRKAGEWEVAPEQKGGGK